MRNKKFNKVKHVKAIARANIGSPPPKQVIDNKKNKKPKHKKQYETSVDD